METQLALKDDPRFREPLELATAARSLVVTRETKLKAEELLLMLGEAERQVRGVLDPICEAANRAHKTETGQREDLLRPIEEARLHLRRGCAGVQRQLEEEATAEARRKAAELEAEERVRLKAKAETSTDMREVVEAIVQAEKVSVSPELVKEAPARAEGISYRDNWTFEWVDRGGRSLPHADLTLIPLAYHQVDDKAIRATVKGLKDKTQIPGVRVHNDRQPVQSGR